MPSHRETIHSVSNLHRYSNRIYSHAIVMPRCTLLHTYRYYVLKHAVTSAAQAYVRYICAVGAGSLRQDASCCSTQWLQPPSCPIQALRWTASPVRGQSAAGPTPACSPSSSLPAPFTSPLPSPSGTYGPGSSSCGELPTLVYLQKQNQLDEHDLLLVDMSCCVAFFICLCYTLRHAR